MFSPSDTPIPVFCCLCFLFPAFLKGFPASAEHVEFNRDLFGVWFEPWIFPSDDVGVVAAADAYDESDFESMLSTISTRFRRILLREVTSDMSPQVKHYLNTVPGLAATLNRNRTTAGGGSDLELEPLKLEMLYDAGSPFNLDDAVANFDVAKGMADQSNSIFNGTVSTLTIRFANDFSLNSSSSVVSGFLHNFTKVMEQLRAKVTIRRGRTQYHGYKLGALLSIEDCAANSSEALAGALDLLDSVTFYRWLPEPDYALGVDAIVEITTRRLELCKRVISQLGRKAGRGGAAVPGGKMIIRPRFLLDYSDTPPNSNGSQNIGAFVHFWELISQWATATGTSVVVSEAFDNYLERNKEVWRTHEGWWRAQHVITGPNGTSSFVFEEKASLLDDSEEIVDGSLGIHHPREASSTSSTTTTTILISAVAIGTVVLVLVLGILALGVVMYRRIVSQIRSQYLSKEEISEFFEGSNKLVDPSLPLCTKELQSTPYNKELELNYETFQIDDSRILGAGSSGVVLRAHLLKGSCGAGVDVAVKMTKPASGSAANFGLKGLLYEIKILDYVGEHENIVKLIGAYTAELMKGKVYIFYELCSNGSLERYLRSNKSELQKKVVAMATTAIDVEGLTQDEECYENTMEEEDGVIKEEAASIPQFVTWTSQILAGMEFLASKQVFHGDLATRNVLLSGDNYRVKLSDFGLSRRLYDYTNYVKSGQEEPLPWRWMPPESLRCYEFNEKTDVWAFGITLWEIYSFGAVPYAGLNWSGDFVTRLEQGLKPDQPQHACRNVHTLMNKCWALTPSSRPTFTELKGLLQTYHM